MASPRSSESGVNGILVEPGDAEALGEAMASIAVDEALLASLREGAQASGEQYGQEAVFGAIEAQLELAAAGS